MTAPFAERYDNFIGGKWVAPKDGRYFDNISSVTGRAVGKIVRSQAADVEAALDAAHAAKQSWGRNSAGERALILNRIADRMEENLEKLAIAETWDNGKPLRETMAADIRWRSITSAISQAASVRRKAAFPKSTTIRSPIISTSRSAWSARSSPGISPSSWRRGSWRPPWRPAIVWC